MVYFQKFHQLKEYYKSLQEFTSEKPIGRAQGRLDSPIVFILPDYSSPISIALIRFLKKWFERRAKELKNLKFHQICSLSYIKGNSIEFSNEEYNGANYNDYSGSLVEFYVNNYKLLLESKFDIKVADARLITKEELISEKIGCSESNTTCKDSPYEWIYSTSYWTQSTYLTYLWYVYSHGFFGNFANYETDYAFGVRPVIVISKDSF